MCGYLWTDAYHCQWVCKENYCPRTRQIYRPSQAENRTGLELHRRSQPVRRWSDRGTAKKRQDGMTFQPCRPATIKLLPYGGAPFARPHLFCKRFLSFWSQFRCFFYFKNRMIRQSNSLSQYKKYLFSFLSSLYSFWPSSIPNSIRSTTCVTSSVPFFRYVSLGRFCRLRRLLLPRCQYP